MGPNALILNGAGGSTGTAEVGASPEIAWVYYILIALLVALVRTPSVSSAAYKS